MLHKIFKTSSKQKLSDVAVSEIAVRTAFIGGGLILFWLGTTTFYDPEFRWQPQLVLLQFLLYGLAFGLCWLGASARFPERHQVLILIGLIIGLLTLYLLRSSSLRNTYSTTDAFLHSDFAADLLLVGENPYSWDMTAAYTVYEKSPFFSTPQLDGSTVSRFGYPALHFLLPALVKLSGLAETSFLYVMAWIGCLIIFFIKAPGPLKGIVLLPLIANREFLEWPTMTMTDPVWVLFLLAMIVSWNRPIWRAFFFGLACSYKQQAWLLAPFLLLRIWLDEEDPGSGSKWKRIVRFAGISGLLFLLLNLPFVLNDAINWSRGIISIPLNWDFYFGQGLSATTQFGLLPLTKEFYLLAALVIFVMLFALYWLNFRQLKEAVWILPALVMWFSYRSIQNYFIYAIPLILMALLVNYDQRPETGKSSVTDRRIHRHTLAVISVAALLLVAGAWIFSSSERDINANLIDANGVSAYQINEVELQIANLSPEPISPRVAVQIGSSQPLPWNLDSGPFELDPGQTGIYQGSTQLPHRMIDATRGAQLVVTDGYGNYDAYAALKIPGDISLTGNGIIYNSNYLGSESLPHGWTIHSQTENVPTVQREEIETGLSAVSLTLHPSSGSEDWEYIGLSQQIEFPENNLSIWLFPPPWISSNDPISAVYGIEIDDGKHRLWLLFGGDSGSGRLSEDHYYYSYPAPQESWSQQSIDLSKMYRDLEWSLPPLQRIVKGDTELLASQIEVRLLVAARDQGEQKSYQAIFGPLNIDTEKNPVPERINYAVNHQSEYYRLLGDSARSQRNYDRALELYSRSLDSVETALTHEAIGSVLMEQGDCSKAISHFRQAITLEDGMLEAQRGLAECSD